MNVEKFTQKIGVSVLIKRTFELEQHLHQKQSSLQITELKFEIMLSDYPHSKSIHNLKVVKFKFLKKIKSIEYNFKFSKILYHM